MGTLSVGVDRGSESSQRIKDAAHSSSGAVVLVNAGTGCAAAGSGEAGAAAGAGSGSAGAGATGSTGSMTGSLHTGGGSADTGSGENSGVCVSGGRADALAAACPATGWPVAGSAGVSDAGAAANSRRARRDGRGDASATTTVEETTSPGEAAPEDVTAGSKVERTATGVYSSSASAGGSASDFSFSVQAAPSHHRCDADPHGSGYHPAGTVESSASVIATAPPNPGLAFPRPRVYGSHCAFRCPHDGGGVALPQSLERCARRRFFIAGAKCTAPASQRPSRSAVVRARAGSSSSGSSGTRTSSSTEVGRWNSAVYCVHSWPSHQRRWSPPSGSGYHPAGRRVVAVTPMALFLLARSYHNHAG